MTDYSDNKIDLTSLSAIGDALLFQTIQLRAQISAASFSSTSSNVNEEFAIGRHWTFSPDQEKFSQPPVQLKPYSAILPGIEFGYESQEAVSAVHKLLYYRESTESSAPAYLFRVSDPAATRWLTLELLLDAGAAKELGLIAITLTACCLPTLKISSMLRIYSPDNTYSEFPGITKILSEKKTTLVDGFVIPSDIRDRICPSTSIRYIFCFPIIAFDFILFEAAAYPSVREAGAPG